MTHDDEEWNSILTAMQDLCDDYGTGIVIIGGVAVWLYSQALKDERLMQKSHDADFYISVENFCTLRTFEVITSNRRLGKYQIMKNGADFDVYVERQSSLIVPFEAIRASAQLIDGMQCASLGHLLTLKTHAYAERKMSDKGVKDAADIAKILMMIATTHTDSTDDEKLAHDMMFFLDEETPLLDRVLNSNAIFYAMSGKNDHISKSYKQLTAQGLHHVKKALSTHMDTSPNSDTGEDTGRRAGPKIPS